MRCGGHGRSVRRRQGPITQEPEPEPAAAPRPPPQARHRDGGPHQPPPRIRSSPGRAHPPRERAAVYAHIFKPSLPPPQISSTYLAPSRRTPELFPELGWISPPPLLCAVKEKELGDAQAEIKALRLSDRAREKAVQDVSNPHPASYHYTSSIVTLLATSAALRQPASCPASRLLSVGTDHQLPPRAPPYCHSLVIRIFSFKLKSASAVLCAN